MTPAPILTCLLVGAGGSVGALLRHALAEALARPWATLSANLLGCLAIGVLLGSRLSDGWRAFLVVGVLGAFTTFSTFGHEAVTLWSDGQRAHAALYVAGSVLLGLSAVVLGRWLATGTAA